MKLEFTIFSYLPFELKIKKIAHQVLSGFDAHADKIRAPLISAQDYHVNDRVLCDSLCSA